jgi:ribosomal protein S17E
MGKIKSKFVRRTAGIFKQRDVEFFEEFDKNKKMLKDTMPSKKIRNRMAGFLSRVKRQEREEEIQALKQ